MRSDVIVDVELQSYAGTVLKKRVQTIIKRLVADEYDSGWKVFFIIGAY